jgi:hypothetical protein
LYHGKFFMKLYKKFTGGLEEFGEQVATGKEGNEVSAVTAVFEKARPGCIVLDSR